MATTGTTLQPVVAELTEAVKALDVALLTGTQAKTIVTACATIEKLAGTARMLAAVRVANTDAWQGEGHQTAADCLAAQTGTSVGEAARQLRTARKVSDLPKTERAMREGKLSPDQAGEVADAASADPDVEDTLLGAAAEDTFKGLKDKAQRARAAATDHHRREQQIRNRRNLRTWTDADGAHHTHICGPAADGARLEALLRPWREHLHRTQPGVAGERPSFDQRSYDALMALLGIGAPGAQAAPAPATSGASAASDPGSDGAASGGASPDGATRGGGASGGATSDDSAPDGSASGGPAGPAGPGAGAAGAPVGRAGGARLAGGAAPRAGASSDAVADGGADRAAPGHASRPPGSTEPGARPAGPDLAERSAPAAPPSGAGPGPVPDVLPRPVPSPQVGGHNIKVIVRIDHAALVRGHTVAGETCEVAGVGPISVRAARELMSDAFIAAVILKGHDVVNVAHLGRGANAYQRTALEATDAGIRCSNRACNRTVAIQIDHRVPYTADRRTVLANQDPLCPACHRQKTHHGWHLEPGTGPRRFLPPSDPRSPHDAPASDPATHAARAAARAGDQAPVQGSVTQPRLC